MAASAPGTPPRSLPRLFVDEALAEGASVTVDGNYLAAVLRLGPGDQLKLFDDRTGEWLAWEGSGRYGDSANGGAGVLIGLVAVAAATVGIKLVAALAVTSGIGALNGWTLVTTEVAPR